MKTTLRYLRLNSKTAWHRQVEQQLNHLHGLTPITATEVILEHQKGITWKFSLRLSSLSSLPRDARTRETGIDFIGFPLTPTLTSTLSTFVPHGAGQEGDLPSAKAPNPMAPGMSEAPEEAEAQINLLLPPSQ